MIVLRSSDSMNVETFVATKRRTHVLLPLVAGYNFIVVQTAHKLNEIFLATFPQSKSTSDFAASRNRNLRYWVVETVAKDALPLAVHLGGIDATISFGNLAEKVHAILRAKPKAGTEALGEIFHTIFVNPNDAPELPQVLDDETCFALLHGCLPIARRLGKFAAEVTLINAALNIRNSRNLLRMLSYAQAKNHQYMLSEETTRKAVAADPAIAKGKFSQLQNELRAFSRICTELTSFAENKCAPAPTNGRIGYCLHNSLPFAQGGYAMRSHSIAVELKAAGRDVDAFARPGFPMVGPKKGDDGEVIETIDEIPYHFRPGSDHRSWPYTYIAEAADYFERALSEKRVGIVQAATNFWTALPAAIAARRLGLPFVYEIRSFWDVTREAREPGFRGTPQAWRDNLLETITLALADHVVTLNPIMRDHLSNYGVSKNRISIAPNCVRADFYRDAPVNSTLAKQYGIELDDFIIGYLGAMVGYEGLSTLIDATSTLLADDPKMKVLLVGADAAKHNKLGSIEHALLSQIEEYGLSDQILLIDRIPPTQVPELLRLVDICVYPRLSLDVCELVSPLKPLEAMAARKGVIASDVQGMADIVKHRKTGLVHKAGDAEDLRTKLQLMIGDSDLRNTLGRNAGKFVEKERRWSRSVACIIVAQETAQANYQRGLSDDRCERLISSVKALRNQR